MPATIIMGGQWGDEGKGKLTDSLASRAHLVIRANGGSNAGHTVETPAGAFKMHLVPSGILNPGCLCVIGAGVVVDPPALVREMAMLIERGVSVDHLVISDRAHVVLPYHPIIDGLEETSRDANPIGTTKRGNGPAYSDKVARRGVRMVDLADPDRLRAIVTAAVEDHNRVITRVYGGEPLSPAAVVAEMEAAAKVLRPHIAPAEVLVQDALADGKEALIECAQGPMLDIDYGTYPFVTSSSPTAAGACQGAGVAPTQVRRVVAVYKAYTTRVGSGPMPTELHDAIGQEIRDRGREYGTVTRRPRRIGWFDGPAARHVARLNGVTEIALTLVDVLDVFSEIQVCTDYEIDGQPVRGIPARVEELARVVPIYRTLPGWNTDITGARLPTDLPTNARAYVEALAGVIGAPITMVGVGPARAQLVPLTTGAAIADAAAVR